MRLRFLVLPAFLLVLACSDRQEDPAAADERIVVRVMTFNIEWGGTHVSFDNVVEAIRRSDADVVGIQEAEGNLERLAAALGWHYDLQNYAISKYPLVAPRQADGRYVLVEVMPGKIVALANVHLPSDPYGPDRIRDGAALEEIVELERETRLPALEPWLADLPALAARGIPVFLTGDFNAPSHRDWTEAAVGTRPFLRYAVDWPVSRALADAGLRDSWREVHADPVRHPGLTWWAARPPLAAYAPGENDPQDRIDFVWYAGPAEVRDSIIVGEQGRAGVTVGVAPWPSDHRAVLSTFSVSPAAMPRVLGTGKHVYRAGDEIELVYFGDDARATAAISRLAADGSREAVGMQPIASGVRKRLAIDALAPGHYEVSVAMPDGTELRNEFWILGAEAQPDIEVGGGSFGVGEPIPVAWRNAPGNRNDYVAVSVPGSAAGYEAQDFATGLPWAYVDALPEGRLCLGERNAAWGWPIPPGTYVMRLMKDDGYEVLAESASFEVRRHPPRD